MRDQNLKASRPGPEIEGSLLSSTRNDSIVTPSQYAPSHPIDLTIPTGSFGTELQLAVAVDNAAPARSLPETQLRLPNQRRRLRVGLGLGVAHDWVSSTYTMLDRQQLELALLAAMFSSVPK
uniref:Uncharacterized protein n=1 Tax=Rhodococcus sp. NS1 TaxID=402236 RepID=A0A097SPY9_9NOCA|nr:hypothetical protein LRS1606.150 [Rhodococcus sp. NS1]